MIQPGDTILFQGDSITHAGRDSAATGANSPAGLGRGYAFHAAGMLLARHPGAGLGVFNRGVGGNRVPELAARWQADCLDLAPSVLSILIGVNDEWRFHDGRGEGVGLEAYERGYRELLERTRTALPGVRLVLCEPFVLRCGAVNDDWFPRFDDRRAIVRRLAGEFGAVFVPFQAVFNEAAARAEPASWAGDGVHPTVAGHMLMAEAWVDCVLGGGGSARVGSATGADEHARDVR